MQYNGLIVSDFDDTLINFALPSFENYNMCAESHGWGVVPWDVFKRAHTYTWEDKFRAFWPDLDPETVTIPAYKAYRGKKPYTLIPGANDAIQELYKRYLLGILTTRPDKRTVEETTGKAGLILQPFELVITQEEMQPYRKPDARVFYPFKRLAGERGIDESRLWYVGDEIVDFETTRNAKVRFVAVTTGLRLRQDFLEAGVPEPDIIGSVENLPKYMETLLL